MQLVAHHRAVAAHPSSSTLTPLLPEGAVADEVGGAPGDAAQVAAAGGSRVRVFGSVSTGGEHEGSDIDLLIRAAPGTGLLEISRLELRLSELLGTGVDVVPDDSIRPSMRRRILSEAALL